MRSFDWVGAALFTSGLTILLISLHWAGNEYSWSDGHVLGAFFAGLVTLIAFCVWEVHCPHELPLMPMKLFRNYEYDSIVICAAVAAMLYFAGAVLWPVMIEALFTQNVSRVGWLSCVVGGGTILGQILGGLGVRYIPRMKLQMVVAGSVMMTFIAAIAAAKPGTEMRTTAFMLIGTTAAGYCDNLALSTMALMWEPDDIGLVAGVLSVFRSITGAIATSMYSSILMTEMKQYLARYVGLASIHAGLAEDSIPAVLDAAYTGNLSTIPDLDPEAFAAIEMAANLAYSLSFRTVFLCTIPFGAILLIAAIGWVPDVERYMTSEVARKLQIDKPHARPDEQMIQGSPG